MLTLLYACLQAPWTIKKCSKGSVRQLPSTKAIVFSQFWMHLQLIAAHLMQSQVEFALLKRDLQHRTKQEALAKFQVGAHLQAIR